MNGIAKAGCCKRPGRTSHRPTPKVIIIRPISLGSQRFDFSSEVIRRVSLLERVKIAYPQLAIDQDRLAFPVDESRGNVPAILA